MQSTELKGRLHWQPATAARARRLHFTAGLPLLVAIIGCSGALAWRSFADVCVG